MKPLIVVYSLLMMLFCCSCGDRRVTEENAYEGVSNYCHQTYDWSIAQENPSIMYVKMGGGIGFYVRSGIPQLYGGNGSFLC